RPVAGPGPRPRGREPPAGAAAPHGRALDRCGAVHAGAAPPLARRTRPQPLGLRSLRPRAAHPGARRLRAARPLTVPPVPPTSQEPMMTTAPTPSTATRPSGLWLDQVDESVRLQDDLFGHVNGRWLREHEMPAD